MPAEAETWESEFLRSPGSMLRAHSGSRFVESAESPAWRIWAHAFCGAIEQKLLRIPG